MERLSALEKKRKEKRLHPEINLTPIEQEYVDFLEGKRREAKEQLNQDRLDEAYLDFLIQQSKDKHEDENKRRSLFLAKEELLEKEETLLKNDPDYAYCTYEKEYLNDVSLIHQGKLISVPYLKHAKERILTSLKRGIPVYLVGHLGSGKTELANEASQEYSQFVQLQSLLEENGFYSDYTSKTDKRCFERDYEYYQRELESKITKPYFLSGSNSLSIEDMFVEKTLTLEKKDNQDYSQQLKDLLSSFEQFLSDNKNEMEKLDSKSQLEFILAGWKTFSNMAISENSAFGTVVKKVDKEVLLAVKKGRPVIIDELNAIPMSSLIALNDILQHHAGEECYITGVGKVQIKKGFALLATGNQSTSSVYYEGTNTLNPAFQSRFVTIAYNYLPQRTEGKLEERKNPEKDELYRLILTYLSDQNGNLSLPEMNKTLKELYSFAEYARKTQEIFSAGDTGEKDSPVLTEAVLSIRNIIHVLDFYDYGEEMDLSMAIYEGFISSVTNADDRNLLLSLAYQYGFFLPEEGWSIQSKKKGEAPLELDDIRLFPYHHQVRPLETISVEDVIFLTFPALPKRRDYPDELKKEIQFDEEPSDVISLMKLEERLKEAEHGKAVLDALKKQE